MVAPTWKQLLWEPGFESVTEMQRWLELNLDGKKTAKSKPYWHAELSVEREVSVCVCETKATRHGVETRGIKANRAVDYGLWICGYAMPVLLCTASWSPRN